MNFEEIRQLGQYQRVNFVRDIKSEITALEDGRIVVVSRLLDEHHDISAALLLDNSLVITECAARMERMPHSMCVETVEEYENVKGIYVFQRGVIREIRSRIERTTGCTHITEILEASLRALFAGMYNIRKKDDLVKVLSKEEKRQLNILRPVLVDTCRSFRKSDQDMEVVGQALQKIKDAGYDPAKLDPHRGST